MSKRNYSDSAKIDLCDGDSVVVLSCIDNGPKFRDHLLFLLKSLDKSFRYEIEFSLYLRTNDENKKLLILPLSNSNLTPENFIMTQILFENLYKFKGYFGFITEKYFYNSEEDLIRFVSSIFTRLGEIVINNNENLSHDEFIEFKRPVIVKIIKLDKVR